MIETKDKISGYKMLKTFLGTTEIPGTVVLTPLSPIYEELRGRLYSKERTKCWWKNCTVKTEKDEEAMIVKTEMGSAVVDSVITLSNKCDYLLFLGFCGGLHPDMKLGDITVATCSYFEKDEEVYTPTSDLSEIKSAFSYSVPGMNLTVESVVREAELIKSKPNYVKQDTVSVDMETAFLYKESRCPSASVMVISDLPKSKTVFDIDFDEMQLVKAGTSKLAGDVLKLIDLL